MFFGVVRRHANEWWWGGGSEFYEELCYENDMALRCIENEPRVAKFV